MTSIALPNISLPSYDAVMSTATRMITPVMDALPAIPPSIAAIPALLLTPGNAGQQINDQLYGPHADPNYSPIYNQSGGNIHDVYVPSDKYPESAQHIQDAQNNGQPSVLTIDRGGAQGRRAAAMNGQPTVPGRDRDEYPPAMFGEGGAGASVRPISPSDNRGAGSCVGAQCRGLPDGSRVRIVPR